MRADGASAALCILACKTRPCIHGPKRQLALTPPRLVFGHPHDNPHRPPPLECRSRRLGHGGGDVAGVRRRGRDSDRGNLLRVPLPAAETGFDPVQIGDISVCFSSRPGAMPLTRAAPRVR